MNDHTPNPAAPMQGRAPGSSCRSGPQDRRPGVCLPSRTSSTPILALLLAPLFLVSLLAAPASGQGVGEFVISIGDVTVLPGSDQVLVPIHMTNSEPVQAWSMGLDYDDLLLGVVDASVDETASEPLLPAVFLGGAGSAVDLQVIYPAGSPLPAGEAQRVLWLVVEVIDPSSIPPGGSLIEILGITSEPPTAAIELDDGTIVTPTTANGSVALYSPPVVLAGAESGGPFDGQISVPLQAWTAGPATTLEMGLDYDDLLLCEFDATGGDLPGLMGGDFSVTLPPVPWGDLQIIIMAENGAQIPLLDGAILGHLVFDVGPAEVGLENLFSGLFPIDFVDSSCFVDAIEVENTLSGAVEVRPEFIRGDVNFSGSVDAADIILILDLIFPNASSSLVIPCHDAADTNDDGALNISDAIRLITYVFNVGSGGLAPPPSPFPGPGMDPTADALDCLGN
jgi:hypothetical protein